MGKKTGVFIGILFIFLAGYIVYDQNLIPLLSSEKPEAITGIQHTWYMNSTSPLDFDNVITIPDSKIEFNVTEGESVYFDFRAILYGYDEIDIGSVTFYFVIDEVIINEPNFKYTLEVKTGSQFQSVAFQHLNSSLVAGIHTAEVFVSEFYAENPSLIQYSFLVQTLNL